MRKLEIGSGNLPQEGYEHLDINPECPCLEYVAPMDEIPVEDNTFDRIVSIHVLEHQEWRKVLKTLTEWVRVLKPGGQLRIITPNFRWIAQSYIDSYSGNNEELMKDANIMTPDERKHISLDGEISPGLWANFKIMSSQIPWDLHYACLDANIMSSLLMSAGACKAEVEHDGDCLIMKAYK